MQCRKLDGVNIKSIHKIYPHAVIMASTRHKVLSLYKSLLRECQRLNSYNFRMYALEKVRCEFHANKEITDSEKIAVLVAKAQENLDIVKRQVLIGHMYGEGHLVIEHHENVASKKT